MNRLIILSLVTFLSFFLSFNVLAQDVSGSSIKGKGHVIRTGTLETQNARANTISVFDALVVNGSDVDISAVSSVHIRSNFHVEKGGTFHGVATGISSRPVEASYSNDIPNTKLFVENENIDEVIVEEDFEISIYPNPTTDFINVSVPVSDKAVYVFLYDLNGRLLLSAEKNSNNFRVSLENLKTGMYFVKIETNNTIKDYKIIKK